MGQDYLARIAALEDALRQKDSQLSLVAETESFLSSALVRAEEKIENEEREIEHLRAQIEKLRRMLFGTRSEKLRRQVERSRSPAETAGAAKRSLQRTGGRSTGPSSVAPVPPSSPVTGTPSPRESSSGASRNLLPGLRQRYEIPQRSQRGAAGTGLQRPESDPNGQGGLHLMRQYR